MMEISFKWCSFYLCLLFFQLCNGNPINPKNTETDSHAKLLSGVITLLLTVCCLVFLAACLCCQRRKRFEHFRNSPITASSISDLDHGHVNPIASAEFTIFSPLSAHYNNNVFHKNETKSKTVEDTLANSYDISSWFNSDERDYPRTKLKYIKELGSGWFGKVVEGAVQDVDNKGQSWTPVVVRILEATSSQKDKVLFLQNAAIYKIGTHVNILNLVGKSLETVPYLLLQEHCPQGDLKTYLRSHKVTAEDFLATDLPLIWCHQLTSALKYIHEHNIVHSDLASRNCHLTSDLTLKLGDYGLGPFKYPADYYQGEPAVPVRWCAPESLICTQTTIQPKRITPESNVWSLAVTMWEICECGEQPYLQLSDDEVISQVLGAAAVRLRSPTYSVLYTDYIFKLMQLCWTSAESRPKVVQIHTMLSELLQVYKNATSTDTLDIDEFDRRWESCKPNTIIKTDQITDTLIASEDDDDDDVRKSLSLSLTNLHGSLDNLNFSDQEINTNEKSNRVFNAYDPFQRQSSGSETEEENWRCKVERGAYTEQVRQKSRSVADLMILTHVDYSESESETPLQSLEYRVNYKNVRLAGLDGVTSLENTSLTTFGSEGNLLSIQDEFKEELKKLQEERRDSLPLVPVNVSQSSRWNAEATSNLSPSRLMHELNNPVDIQPANQIFNIYNVTIDKFSPIQTSNKFSEILSKINSELTDDVRESERFDEIQKNVELNDCRLTETLQNGDTSELGRGIEIDRINNVSPKLNGDLDTDNSDSNSKLKRDSKSCVELIEAERSNSLLTNDSKDVLNGRLIINSALNGDIDRADKSNDEMPQETSTSKLTAEDSCNSIACAEGEKLNDQIVCDEISFTNSTSESHKANQTIHPELANVDSSGQTKDFNEESAERLSGVSSELKKEADCTSKTIDGSEYCDNFATNDTLDVLRGGDDSCDVTCEAFNVDVRLSPEANRTVLNLAIEEKRVDAKTLLEESVLAMIDDILTRSIREASGIRNKGDTAKENREQIVNFDLSLTQDEVMPNSLTHSSVFTSSTPFSKKSVDNKFPSIIFDDSKDIRIPADRDLNYSLETWDNFLGSTLDHQNQHPENMFDSFSSEPKSLLFIEGEDVNTNYKRAEAANKSYPILNNAARNIENGTFDVEKGGEQVDVLLNNVTFVANKSERDALETYSGGIWDSLSASTCNFANQDAFDNYSSEPQSLIFIESEGIYKKCDNEDEVKNRKKSLDLQDDGNSVDNVEKIITDDEDGDTEDCAGSSVDEILNGTYTKENGAMNSTFTKEKPDVLDCPSEGFNENSFENQGGWYLHPQPTNDLIGEIKVQSPSTDTYIGFGIDDEIMSAIRNELLIKLPHAQGNSSERVKDEDEWDSFERNEVFLRYNVYNTPLSPIPEESYIEDISGTNSPKRGDGEETDWSGRTDTDTITHDIETPSAHTPSPIRGTLNRHTPSQDSCCSNDTLFNLEDLICGTTELEKDPEMAINLEDIEENVESDNEKHESKECKIDESSETLDSVSSTPKEAVNKFLSSERNYTSVVPLPSPEENPWKQLPASLLNYNHLTLSSPLTVSEEPKRVDETDCDNTAEQSICDTGIAATEQEEEKSDKLNVTFIVDHSRVLQIPIGNPVEKETKPKENSVADSDILNKENIEPLYENCEVKEEIHPISGYSDIKNEGSDKKMFEKDDPLSEHLYDNINTNNVEPFDDYVNIVNIENSKNRLESDLSDKDHAYIDTYEKDEDDSIYGILTDIRFTGPADSQMMSTSFSENNDEQGWESGSDSRSSSSGEFIWREGEHEESLKALRAAPQDVLESITPMEGIVEDNFEESDLSSTSFSDDEESPEFVPSAWDKFAIPSKSALRSPEKTVQKTEEKKPKGVWFKKQKYHCIYEYPKEPESPVLPNHDVWKQTDFKVFSDNPTSTNLSEEFFISSSSQPFHSHSMTSQFFPGNSSWNFDNVTPDSGMEDITPGSNADLSEFPSTVPTLKQLASDVANKRKPSKMSTSDVLGGLRHTRKLLKLDLPPSPSAFTSEKMFAIESTAEPVVRDKPTFTTFGKSRFLVQHVDTPPDEIVGKNVSFEALPYKPLSPISDCADLEAYKPTILDDYSANKTDVLERSLIKNEDDDKCRLKVEMVRGEASLLDSGDEDSGIESTSTLERKTSNPEV